MGPKLVLKFLDKGGLLRKPRAHYQSPLMLKAIDGQLPHERRFTNQQNNHNENIKNQNLQ